MKAVVQRVTSAHVTVEGEVVGKIGPGLLILLGIQTTDSEKEGAWLAEKVANLRIFSDEMGKMNLSASDRQLEALVISQFTLYGNCLSGRRPDFLQAARPEQAEPLYQKFCGQLGAFLGKPVQTGRFGAQMSVHLINDGPVTLILDKAKNS